jgi:hypothetical protein
LGGEDVPGKIAHRQPEKAGNLKIWCLLGRSYQQF